MRSHAYADATRSTLSSPLSRLSLFSSVSSARVTGSHDPRTTDDRVHRDPTRQRPDRYFPDIVSNPTQHAPKLGGQQHMRGVHEPARFRRRRSRCVTAGGCGGGAAREHVVLRRVHLRYEGTDTPHLIDVSTPAEMQKRFEDDHRQRYGFIMPEKALIIEAAAVEAIGIMTDTEEKKLDNDKTATAESLAEVFAYMAGAEHGTPVYDRDTFAPGTKIVGPAVIREQTATTIVEPKRTFFMVINPLCNVCISVKKTLGIFCVAMTGTAIIQWSRHQTRSLAILQFAIPHGC